MAAPLAAGERARRRELDALAKYSYFGQAHPLRHQRKWGGGGGGGGRDLLRQAAPHVAIAAAARIRSGLLCTPWGQGAGREEAQLEPDGTWLVDLRTPGVTGRMGSRGVARAGAEGERGRGGAVATRAEAAWLERLNRRDGLEPGMEAGAQCCSVLALIRRVRKRCG